MARSDADLDSRIPEIVATLPLRVDAAVRDGTETMARAAAAAAPVRTSALKRSIEAGSKHGQFGILAAWYWFFNEFGTVNQAAHPFMIPAVEANRERLHAQVRNALDRL